MNPTTTVSSLASTSVLAQYFHICTRFSAARFGALLQTSQIGRFLLHRATCESTQDLAKRESIEGAPSGTLVVADEQTKGRGRIAGRIWRTKDSGNLAFTLLLRPRTASLLGLNLAVAVAVAQAIRSIAQPFVHAPEAQVKWPNDVLLGQKKVAGILIDADFIGSSISVTIGVGINVNEEWSTIEDDNLRSSATSLRTALGEMVDRESLLASVCNRLETLLVEPFNIVLELYRSLDCLVGNEVLVMPKKMEDASSHYIARAVGFSPEGFLLVHSGNNEPVVLVAEEVSIRFPS